MITVPSPPGRWKALRSARAHSRHEHPDDHDEDRGLHERVDAERALGIVDRLQALAHERVAGLVVPGQEHRQQQGKRGDGGEALLAGERAPVAPDAGECAGHAATRSAAPTGIEFCGAIPRAIVCGAGTDTPPESGGLLDTAAATRFPALVPRSNPVVTRARRSARWRWSPSRRSSSSSSAARRRRPGRGTRPVRGRLVARRRPRRGGTTSDPAVAAKALAANRRGLDGARVQATRVVDQGRRRRRARPLRLAGRCPRSALRLRHAGRAPPPRRALAGRLGPDASSTRASPRTPPRDGRSTPRAGADPRPRRPPARHRRAVVRVGVARHGHGRRRDRRRPRRPSHSTPPPSRATATRRPEAVRRGGRRCARPTTTPKQAALEAIEGAADGRRHRPARADARRFARALLGTVGPVTAEQLERSAQVRRRREVGQFGLEARFEKQLAGTPTRGSSSARERARRTRRCAAARAAGRARCARRSTATCRPRPSARSATASAAALVAVQPSTGDVLAVANRPADADVRPRARRPLPARLDVQGRQHGRAAARRPQTRTDTVACPQTINVGGRTFKNFEGEAAGAVPFAQDFAQSCNTAFVSLAGPPAGRRAAAHRARLRPRPQGQPAAHGRREPGPAGRRPGRARGGDDRPGADPREPAADGGRRGDRRRRPLARAAAREHRPASRRAGARPRRLGDAARRSCAASSPRGTGTALAGVPGELDRQERHGRVRLRRPAADARVVHRLRGDLAVAVLVERGRSGGSVAAPIAARFFEAVPGAEQQAAQTAPPP